MLLLAFAVVAYVLLWVGTSSAKTKTVELQAQQASIQQRLSNLKTTQDSVTIRTN